jgi:hypothetical protein
VDAADARVSVRFRLPEPVEVEPIGVDTHSAIWLGQRADRVMLAEAARIGLSASEGPGDRLTATPGGLATGAAMRAFLRAAQGVPGDVIGRLDGAVAPWCEEPAFGPPARLLLLRGGGEADPDRLARATEVAIPTAPRVFPIPTADAPGGGAVEVALADEVLVSAHHYAGLLWANLLGLAPTLYAQLLGPNQVLAGFRLLGAVLRARSLQPSLIAARLNRVEAGAFIHPAAVVEASWVGRGAQIGAGAVVRGCILGEGASVEPNSVLLGSVLGPNAHLQRMGWAHWSLFHPGAAHAGAMQLGVLGPGCSVKGGAYLLDQHPDGAVRASVAGRLVQAPLGLLGVGVGARCLIGSGVWVAPGRGLPPDGRATRGPQAVLAEPPSGPGWRYEGG